MKKTLLITLDYPPMIGGVSHYYHNVVKNLPQESILVLHNNDSDLLFQSRFLWPRWIKAVWSVASCVRKKGIEHMLVGQLLPLGTVALFLKFFLSIPYTVMTHAMDVTLPFGDEGSARKQWLVKKILTQATFVTTVSEYTKKQLLAVGTAPQKIHLIYPCPHVVPDAQQPEITATDLDAQYEIHDKRVMLTVARLVERKGVDMAITALAHVVQRDPSVVLVIVGDGVDRTRLQQLVRTKGVQEHVRFVGACSPNELDAWYRRCTLYVMPSRELQNNDVEGFGMVFLEAGLFGKPVIGGNSGGVPDAIVDGVTGFLVDPLNEKEIAEKMLFLLNHPDDATTMGNAARARVQKEFQWSVQTKKIETFLS